MTFEFAKMHGLGNDYVFVDTFHQRLPEDLPGLARVISDRHTGIGGDGLILVGPSDRAPVRMRIFNADGSEAQMCGNGLRCAAKFAYERGLAGDRLAAPDERMAAVLARLAPGSAYTFKALAMETGRGVLTVVLMIGGDNTVEQVCVNMDSPILEPARVPVNLPGESVIARDFSAAGRTFKITCVSMGNPHAVIFCEDPKAIDLAAIGPVIEHHPIFPERTNVHFVRVLDRSRLDMVTWERGSGITMACGTGAAAVCVAGVLEHRSDRGVRITLPGGPLQLFWNEADNCVYKLGPAVEAFRGTYS